MEKLSKFAAQANNQSESESMISSVNKDLDIFRLFKKYTDKIIEEQGKKVTNEEESKSGK